MRSIALYCLLAVVAAPVPYAAEAAITRVDLNIPRQSLDAALNTFSLQTHIQVARMSDQGPPVGEVGPLNGAYEPKAALEALLKNTGLGFEFINDRMVRIYDTLPKTGAATTATDAATGSTNTDASGSTSEGKTRSIGKLRLAQADQGPPAGPASSWQARGSDNEPMKLEEVVVTANKRAESAQSVAAGISVESGEQMVTRSQTQLTDYAAYMPGFYVNNGGSPGQASITLRGISSLTSGSAVATYIDETPLGSSSNWNNSSQQMLDLLPYDVERLEVLRGPQGTLYGAGSMGGLIKYVLKAPSTSDYEGRVGADVSYVDGAGRQGYDVHGRFNAPLVPEVLGASLSLFDRYNPGYIDNAYDGAHDTNGGRSYGGRLALLLKPADDLSIKLSWLEYRVSSYDNAFESFAAVPVTNAAGADIVRPGNSFGDLTESHAFPQLFHKNLSDYALTLDWNPGPFSIVSATAYSRQKTQVDQDFSTGYGALPELFNEPAGLARGEFGYGIDKLTQELRILSPQGGRIDWLAGAFYTHERSTDDQYGLIYNAAGVLNPTFAPYFFEGHLPTTYSEAAGFGDVTWHVIEPFDMTGGVRIAHNSQNFADYTGGALASSPGVVTEPESTQNVVTWSFDSRYRFAPDDMLYTRIAKGYRAGSPNTPGVGVPLTVGPDTLINYELGIKSQFLDRRALLDLAGFWIDWSNIQMAATTPGGFGYYANAGHATSKGFELTSTWSPVRALTFGLNAAYTRSQLTSVASNTNFLIGYQLPNVPKWAASATADYRWAVAANWDAQLEGGVRWLDQEWLSAVETGAGAQPAVNAPSYAVLDLTASLRKGPLTFRAYGRNLTNRRAYQGFTPQSDYILGGLKQLDFVVLQPLTIGVGIDYSF